MGNYKEKAKALLKKMTLEEKIGQLCMYAVYSLDEQGVPKCDGLQEALENGLVGSVIQGMSDFTPAIYKMQETIMEKSRLKIPLLFNIDLIHGFDTIMPVPLAAACSFDTDLVEKATAATAAEAAACGTHWTNSPMLDISRDARWGRVCESQGEDPYLAGEMAKAYVRGYQNEENYMMSTLKHFAAYGACEGGRDYDSAEVSENTMLNTYLVPFKAGVEAGADSVMASFNTVENIPASGNKKYLKHILREKFGFDGVILSDAASVLELIKHGYCEDEKASAKRALDATMDVELGTNCFAKHLKQLVENGEVQEEQIDAAVLRVLETKYKLGLFEDPFKYFKKDKSVLFCEEHLALSEKLASESAVLLENNGVLPLRKTSKIALVGECVRSPYLCGAWQHSSREKDTVTIEQGFQAEGFHIVGVSENFDVRAAEAAAYDADTVVFAVGSANKEDNGGEAASRMNLEFPEEVKRCYDYLLSRNKKVIVLVWAGGPRIVNVFKRADALVYCWHLGSRSGSAIAKLLSGEYNFSGKLVVTIPRDVGQIPIYYNRKPSGRPFKAAMQGWPFQVRYRFGENYPQYPFGYGLSYSKFAYSNLRTEKQTICRGEALKVYVDVLNDSDVCGTEVAQLYVQDPVAEVSRPIRELKAFERVTIAPHEKKTVCFVITEEKLSYYHEDGTFFADAGKFVLFAGGDSNADLSLTFSLEN